MRHPSRHILLSFLTVVLLVAAMPACAGTSSSSAARITFASSRNGNFEIYVMNANGSGQTRLTNNKVMDGYPAWSWMPAWSPDSTRITFSSNRDGKSEIYVMNADGSGQIRLTDKGTENWEPAWQP